MTKFSRWIGVRWHQNVSIPVRMTEVVVTIGAIIRCKTPEQLSTNQHTASYRSDVLPLIHPTVSEHQREKQHWRENITYITQKAVLPLTTTARDWYNVLLLMQLVQYINMGEMSMSMKKSTRRRRKHCALAVVRRRYIWRTMCETDYKDTKSPLSCD